MKFFRDFQLYFFTFHPKSDEIPSIETRRTTIEAVSGVRASVKKPSFEINGFEIFNRVEKV